MIKNPWYLKRKKISLEKGYFYWITIGVFLYVLVASILFLIQYLIKEKWDELVFKNKNIFNLEDNISIQERENLVKVIYLVRFWGIVLILVFLQLLSYFYYKKNKSGYLFPVLWILILIGMLIINIALVKSSPLFYIWKIIPLIIIIIALGFALKEIYFFRKELNKKYYLKIKKGEI